jgi:hypothetical protein
VHTITYRLARPEDDAPAHAAAPSTPHAAASPSAAAADAKCGAAAGGSGSEDPAATVEEALHVQVPPWRMQGT